MLGQGKTKATYQFLTSSENIYNLFFDSTREMYQVNVRSGTKRQVKRRPEKQMSENDLTDWYGEHTDTTPTRSSDNLDTASLPSGSVKESSYSASTVSNTELTGTGQKRSSDYLDSAFLPSGFATESNYSASAMYNADLNGTHPTTSSDSLDSTSLPSGSVTESNYSASTVSNKAYWYNPNKKLRKS